MQIITRDIWGARHGRGSEVTGVRSGLVLHHFAQPHIDCGEGLATEVGAIRGVEAYHADVKGWDGIGYHFVVFQSGRIFEGRGWERQGAHAKGRNRSHYGIALAIDGDDHAATDAAREAVRWLSADAVRLGLLAADYELVGHRDVWDTRCPGDLVHGVLDSFRPDNSNGD